MNLFNSDSPIVRFLEKLANVMILNWLTLLCCIPIVTIGPAITAAYWVTLKMVRNEEGGIIQEFFHSFRVNLKQGMVVGLIVLGIAVFFAFDFYYIYQLTQIGGLFDRFVFIALIFFAAVCVMVVNYVWAILAKFNNTTKQLFKTSFAIAVRHILASFVMGVISAAPFLMLFWSPASFTIAVAFYIFFGIPGIAYLQSIFLVRIFDMYIPKDTDEEDDEENDEEDDEEEEPEALPE